MRGLFKSSAKKSEKSHVLVVGAGEVGFHVAERLVRENRQVTVIDSDLEALKRVAEALDVQIIHGSGCSPSVLEQAGIKTSSIIMAVTSSDEDNLIVCFFANQLAPEANKIARIRNEEYTEYFEKHSSGNIKINILINPEAEMILAIERILSIPAAVEYSEFAGKRIKLLGIKLESGPLLGRPLSHFTTILDEPNVRVAAVIRHEHLIIPCGADTLETGDIAYFICTPEALPALRLAAVPGAGSTHNVLIVGGGNAGLKLAQALEARDYHIKIMEKDIDRCHFLAEKLKKSIVLHGNGTVKDILQEENAGEMDAIIALTSSEETNVLICLLARSLGATRVITRVNNAAYLPLARTLGINYCISPRLAAVNSIMKYIRKGNVLSSINIKDDEAEAIEIIVGENAPIANHSLMDSNIPKGVGILAVLRGEELFIPTGESIIQSGDHVTIFMRKEHMLTVEKIFGS